MSDTPRAEDIAFRVFTEIGILSQLTSTVAERVLPDGMTMAQFSVLNHFARVGGRWRPSDLASAFQVTKATMTSTLKRLEAKGLVAIAADEADGRGRRVEMTGAGAAMRGACLATLGPQLTGIVRAVGVEPFDQALGPLTALRLALDRQREER